MQFKKVHEYTKKLSVLYIEDDFNFREDTSEIFSKLFSHVDTAVDGKDGLEKYLSYFATNNKYYDIVITDINMPYINGIELIKEIYQHDKNQSIIVVSAYNDSEYLMELVNIGIEQFLLKPLSLEEVFEVLYTVSSKILNLNTNKKNKGTIQVGDNLFWDSENLSLFIQENEYKKDIKLTKNELSLLKIFIKNGTRLTTLQELFNVVWKNEAYLGSPESLNQIISRFRRKVPLLTIQSLYGVGYKLIF